MSRVAVIALVLPCFLCLPHVSQAEQPWRAGWCSLRAPDVVLPLAKDVGFNALITHGPASRLEHFAQEAKRQGIEVYFWISTSALKGDESLRQEMSAVEEAAWAKLKADVDPKKHGYQFGGEPLPGRREVLETPLLCLDKEPARDAFKQRIKTVVDACPSLAGVALDYVGYQNYHACYCPETEQLFRVWRQAHARLPAQEARDKFSLERLVWHYDHMARYVRSLRPGLKVAAHVYPVFLPEPLYGNRLNLDYCMQTAAWYFEPYWSEAKVRQYAQTIVATAEHPRSRGVPFVALYVGRPIADKPAERFARELRWVFQASGGTSLSIYDFQSLAQHAFHLQALKEELAAPGAVQPAVRR